MKILLLFAAILLFGSVAYGQDELSLETDLTYFKYSSYYNLLPERKKNRRLDTIYEIFRDCDRRDPRCVRRLKLSLTMYLKRMERISKRRATRMLNNPDKLDQVVERVYNSKVTNPKGLSIGEIEIETVKILKIVTQKEYHQKIRAEIFKYMDRGVYTREFMKELQKKILSYDNKEFYSLSVWLVPLLATTVMITGNVGLGLAVTVGWAVNPILGIAGCVAIASEIGLIVGGLSSLGVIAK